MVLVTFAENTFTGFESDFKGAAQPLMTEWSTAIYMAPQAKQQAFLKSHFTF